MTIHQPLTFDPHQQFRHVVLVGLGGTGSSLARSVCRIVWDLAQRQRHVPTVTFIDPDRVEADNCGRQMFTPADIGAHKAETLARRFSFALGLDVRWHGEPFDAEKHADADTLLLGAVDNHLARQELARACEMHHICYIDAGNAHQSGQVVVGNCGDSDRIRSGIRDLGVAWLPHVGLVFPQILEPEPETPPASAASCADLIARGEQHLLINDAVATVAAHYTYRLLHHQPLTTHVTYLDMDGLNMRSQPLTRESVLSYTGLP